jgi:threonine/homoserine/homoserine lactone efflux protein
MTPSAFANGFLLGWSVAWPPGPVNAEMIRRGLLPKERGGGFWSAWPIGLGACCGDFLWAFCVSIGAGATLNSLTIRRALAFISLALLLFLAVRFAFAAWKIYRSQQAVTFNQENTSAEGSFSPREKVRIRGSSTNARRGGFLLGFLVVLMSPWNIGFWLAVIGSQPNQGAGIPQSLALAAAVVLGALTWGIVLCLAVKFGARIFSHPGWQIATEAVTALVMLWFAIRLLLHFP